MAERVKRSANIIEVVFVLSLRGQRQRVDKLLEKATPLLEHFGRPLVITELCQLIRLDLQLIHAQTSARLRSFRRSCRSTSGNVV